MREKGRLDLHKGNHKDNSDPLVIECLDICAPDSGACEDRNAISKPTPQYIPVPGRMTDLLLDRLPGRLRIFRM